MRFFTILLSLYIFGLALVPCGDADECNEKKELTISENAGHDNHTHDKETCTPFCICSCCGSSILKMNEPAFPCELIPIFSVGFPLYKQSLFSIVYFHIWQPPKIG